MSPRPAHDRPVVATRSPVHGLARRSLPFTDVLAQPLAAVAPSAAATTLPLLVATVAGTGSVLMALAIALVLATAVAACVNQFTRRIAATGSLYTFVVRGLGPRAGIVTGVAMLLGYGAITTFALAGGGWYVQLLATRAWPALAGDGAAGDLPALATVVVLGGVVWWVLRRGIRRSARVTLVVETVSVALIGALVIALLTTADPGAVVHAAVPGTSAADVAVGTAIALTAFVGFESAATLGAEARRPFRTVPRAILWTAVGAGVLYLGAAAAQLVGYSAAGLDLARATSPADELTAAFGVGWAGPVLDVGVIASFLACATASSTALARVLFTMGREGLVPRRFGDAHPVHGTPSAALTATLPALTVIPVAAVLAGARLWEAMQVLLVVAAGGYITAYVLVCTAVPPFLRRIGEATRGAVTLATCTAVVLTGALVTMLAVQGGSPRRAGVWAFLALLAAGAAGGLLRLRQRPRLRTHLGVHDEPVVSDLLAVPEHRRPRTAGLDGEAA
ncbi:amino acid permease-associated region [Xylanimonas cellulosilytica DSM 15894]|uniref:Amino acid permease-associated region n=1 Tax=Xylanimonas cellulosilytica (strain DSM 15894 / JCM 12276 / CECT 5975 / KCTC 9989 / LMG 20990 / NBRC 107835 / XIL07) TaxID=446471 RepID=D1BZU2_XYLCX|nr:APC family permease [Xylanimonas cellulosilytica]ACZ32070.1 amino acid permease-associated region [Xylanimonas cellulosilytica DSM 15894]